MTVPKVSVVVPTWNRPELVKEAVQSVIDQTLQDFEIIVVDDGMERRAEETIKSFHDDRIVYIVHEKNRGCSAAKNTGIKTAKGQYIAILDDDDTWLPEKLAVQLRALEGTPVHVGFSFHASYEVFDTGKKRTECPAGVGDYLDFALRTFSGMIDSSMMYKREVFDKVGGLDERFPTHTGAEFIIRVAKEFRGVGINEPLVERTMESGHVQMGTNIWNRIKGRQMLLERYKDEFAKRPTYLAKHVTQLGIFFRQVGEYKQARGAFRRAFVLQPRVSRFLHWASTLCGGVLHRMFKLMKVMAGMNIHK